MKSTTENQKLPDEIQAVSFVCRSFGIGEDEIGRMLELKQKFTPHSGKCFPKKLWSETLARAKAGEGPWCKAAQIILREALYMPIYHRAGCCLYLRRMDFPLCLGRSAGWTNHLLHC